MHVSAISEIDPRTGVALQLCRLLAQILALQVRTKGCHWHVTGSNFRSLHELFDEQATQLADIADQIAERSRALGLLTVASLADIEHFHPSAKQRSALPDAEGMLAELRHSNLLLAGEIKALRRLADADEDLVGVSLADGWLALTEQRVWLLTSSMSGGGR